MSGIELHSIEKPHETRRFQAHGHMDVVTLGDSTVGKGRFEPGWRWSADVKPIAGTGLLRGAARPASACREDDGSHDDGAKRSSS